MCGISLLVVVGRRRSMDIGYMQIRCWEIRV